MYEFDDATGDSGLEASIRRQRAARDGWPFPGRHESRAEIADETPIFHALTVGDWREQRRSGGSGRGVGRVHRATVRTPRRTAESLAAFHPGSHAAGVPEQYEPAAEGAWNEPGDAALVMLHRRRHAARSAERISAEELLAGTGRHRMSHSA